MRHFVKKWQPADTSASGITKLWADHLSKRIKEETQAGYKYLHVHYHTATENKSTKPAGDIYSPSHHEMEFLVSSL